MVAGLRPLTRKLLRDAWHLRSQMLAIAIVMACGISMFVTLRSMHGWLRDTQASYYERYRFADVFAHARRAPLSLAREVAALPGVATVEPRVVVDVTLDIPGLAEPGTGRLVGIPEEAQPSLNGLHLRRGRFLQPGRAGEVLASEAFATANHLAPGDSISAVINGRWQWLRIVGIALSPEYIYEIRGIGDIFPDNRRFGVLWTSQPALAAAFDMTGGFNDLSLSLAPGASAADVITGLDRLLAPYGGVGAYARDDQLSHYFLDSEITETEVTSILLPGIFLGVTAFLLNMVMARLVRTQRDQVAVLKAFGYTNTTVASHYLQLALVPVLVGAAVGVAFGIWFAGALAGVYARFFQFPDATYTQAWSVVVVAFAVSGGAALLGAIGAVRQAVGLPPAEAMRPEAPPSFRRGIVERLGLQRHVSPANRIILRNLERQPVKAALSVTGIALATSIVLTAWYMFDVMDVLKDIHFNEVQRHDAMVTFEQPRGAGAIDALAGLDGVRLVEPFRMVPVRLRAGPRDYRLALHGLPEGATLQRLVDRHLAVREVPRGGIHLSDVVAEELGVVAGDTVTVEVLEGRRPVRQAVVASVGEDLIGASATMRLDALNLLAGEGPLVSGAYLRIDPLAASGVYATLKRTPAVAGVAVREAVMRGFDETLAESFWISISVMLGFASVIAGGIIYNGARVALSERGRELASLRVLGFTRREVTQLLLGEQALLTAVGIPVGFLLGYGLVWLVSVRLASNLFRIPMILTGSALFYSFLVVSLAAILSSLAVRHRIRRLDLVAVLKTRE
jgi:putative ABC transport system permease protein